LILGRLPPFWQRTNTATFDNPRTAQQQGRSATDPTPFACGITSNKNPLRFLFFGFVSDPPVLFKSRLCVCDGLRCSRCIIFVTAFRIFSIFSPPARSHSRCRSLRTSPSHTTSALRAGKKDTGTQLNVSFHADEAATHTEIGDTKTAAIVPRSATHTQLGPTWSTVVRRPPFCRPSVATKCLTPQRQSNR